MDSNATITWSPSTGLSDPAIADPLASPTTTTTYVVTVEENGCITTDTITVYVDNTIIALTADVGICTGDSIQLSATSNNPIVAWSWNPTVSLSDDTIANPIANPSSSTTYTVTAIDELGCQFTLDVTVSVAPFPTAYFTHSDSALTVMFTDSSVNAGILLWDFGDGFTSGLQNPTYTYAGPGTYNVCLSVSNACTTDIMCELITVTDCQFTLALFSYSVSGSTVDFSDLSINATGWSWDFGDGDTDTVPNPSHTYSGTGAYNVCFTVTNACGSANICNAISITSAIGMTENYLENRINVYPNPNNGEFTLSMNYEFNTNLRIVVYDVLGRVVWSDGNRDLPRGNNEIEIDISDHPAGIYNLQVIMDQGISNRTIIIE